MTPLELLFAAGITIAFLSIIRGVNVELFLGMAALMLIMTLVDMWGFSLVLASFLMFMAGLIRVFAVATGAAHQPGPAPDFDNEPDVNRAAGIVDRVVFDENNGDP